MALSTERTDTGFAAAIASLRPWIEVHASFRRRLVLGVVLMVLTALSALYGAGMQADVALDGDVLRVHIEAPGPGWVAFGISDRAGLRGAEAGHVARNEGRHEGDGCD